MTKNDNLKDAIAEGRIPWQTVVIETRDYVVFRDGYPVTDGHLLFVPTVTDWLHLAACYKAAYAWGYGWVEEGICDGYNIGQNIGESAGQTVNYPHIHLIPRRQGDMTNPQGGVRHVIPERGNYKNNVVYPKFWAKRNK